MPVKIACAMVALGLIAVGMLHVFTVSGEPHYSRQDCIQKVIFDWGDRRPEEVEAVIRTIAGTLTDQSNEDSHSEIQVPDYAFPFANRSEWYLQYRQSCHEKKIKTASLIEKVLEAAIPNMPDYQITDERVIPSTRTISVTGEYWEQDGYQ